MVLFSLGILVDSILTVSFLIKALYFEPKNTASGSSARRVVCLDFPLFRLTTVAMRSLLIRSAGSVSESTVYHES